MFALGGTALLHRHVHDLCEMQRLMIGRLPDLFAAAETIGDDQRLF